MLTALTFVAGLAVLIAGADIFVRGASGLAASLRIPPLIVGLTVVAFGTSAPELAISVQAGLAGSADLAFGNVVGSNIFNVLFILGLSALIVPLTVERRLIRLDVPLVIAASALVLGLGLDGRIGRIDGFVLFAGVVAYTTWLIRQGRAEEATGAEAAAPGGVGRQALRVGSMVAGLAMLVLGSRWLVASSTSIARALSVEELVIGLTIVAAGTSLPEVATSVVAGVKGERDIAVGNVIGSNLFNLLCVLGLTAATTGGVAVAPGSLRADVPVMLASTVACLPIFFSGHRIDRWEGLVFLGFYVAYTAHLVLDAVESPSLRTFRFVMLAFVAPLAAVTLAVVSYREWRGRRR